MLRRVFGGRRRRRRGSKEKTGKKKTKRLRRAPDDRGRRAVCEGRDIDLGGAATPEFRDSESGQRAAMPRVVRTDVRCNPKIE